MTSHFVVGMTILVVFALLSRIAYVLLSIWFGDPTGVPRASRINTLVVLGSGGHTGEMLRITKVTAFY